MVTSLLCELLYVSRLWIVRASIVVAVLWAMSLVGTMTMGVVAVGYYGGRKVERIADGYFIIHKGGRKSRTTESGYKTLRAVDSAFGIIMQSLPGMLFLVWIGGKVDSDLSPEESAQLWGGIKAEQLAKIAFAFLLAMFALWMSLLAVNAALALMWLQFSLQPPAGGVRIVQYLIVASALFFRLARDLFGTDAEQLDESIAEEVLASTWARVASSLRCKPLCSIWRAKSSCSKARLLHASPRASKAQPRTTLSTP